MVIIPTDNSYTPEQLQALINAAINQYLIDNPNQGGNPTDIIQQFIINNPGQFNSIILDYFNGDANAAAAVIITYLNGNVEAATAILQLYFAQNPQVLQNFIDAYLQSHPLSSVRYLSFVNQSDHVVTYSIGVPNQTPRVTGTLNQYDNYLGVFLGTEVYTFGFVLEPVNDIILDRFLRYDGASEFQAIKGIDFTLGNSHNLTFEAGINSTGIAEKIDYDMYSLRNGGSSPDTNGSYADGYAQYPIDHPPQGDTNGSYADGYAQCTVDHPELAFDRSSLDVFSCVNQSVTLKLIKFDGSQFGADIVIPAGFVVSSYQAFTHAYLAANDVQLIRMNTDQFIPADLLWVRYNVETNIQTQELTQIGTTYDFILYPDLRGQWFIIPRVSQNS